MQEHIDLSATSSKHRFTQIPKDIYIYLLNVPTAFWLQLHCKLLKAGGWWTPSSTRISGYPQKAQNAKSSLRDILPDDSKWRGYRHQACIPKKFLLFASDTLTVRWFYGGPTFRVVHPAYIGYHLITIISRLLPDVVPMGLEGVPESLPSISTNHG